ncbi:MAG: glycosyltransferase [Bacteroidota bacterium]|jgi:cellulose synthase/poly-beta-1,6-N-acetylglucosamine synthase-like glycosyltransferase
MSEFFTYLLIAASIAFAAEILVLALGIAKANRMRKTPDYEPTVSIIVAARNEEERIEQCLASLVRLEYPGDKIEIIVVDDRSTDRTPEIIRKFSKQHNSVKTVTTQPRQGNLRGKMNAVALGISVSHGEILMFTDGDCSVPPGWIRETVQFFDAETGIVGGFTLLDARGVFGGMQALDWIYLFGLASGTAGLKIPLTAIGNNLSVRRSAYDASGGYDVIPFSVTEDYALVQAILQKTNYVLRFPVNPLAAVRSEPCRGWRELYRQKQRWGVGGLDMVTRGLVITAVGWVLNLALIVGWWFVGFPVWIAALAVKTLVDTIFLLRPLKELRALSYLKYLPFFEVYFTLYVLAIPLVAILSRDVIWKERRL